MVTELMHEDAGQGILKQYQSFTTNYDGNM